MLKKASTNYNEGQEDIVLIISELDGIPVEKSSGIIHYNSDGKAFLIETNCHVVVSEYNKLSGKLPIQFKTPLMP